MCNTISRLGRVFSVPFFISGGISLTNKLNRRSQQRLKRVIESMENISKFVNKLKIEDIEDLIRRDAIPVEGPSSAPRSEEHTSELQSH